MSTCHRLLTHNVVQASHEIFKNIVSPGDTVIDATCGNGKDSLLLARLLQGCGKLVVYDIQKEALNHALILFETHLSEEEKAIIEIKEQSHEYLSEKDAKLIHYNLGYLPAGNKAITTLARTTEVSLECALNIVRSDGLVTVVCYPGHPEGERETYAVQSLAQQLNPKDWCVSSFYTVNRFQAPRLFIFQRQGSMS
ncbi:class I SAM-dependent methyltransferase [Candidatus Chlamydia corallus]|uniref:class I SAM-dependent methyltransferase n=1 Tax=Candidatus Chlamydia corallus TaxID=2038470 RepID=UPI000C2FAC8D|nr:class I SAM-dependent methyltransferase [Candidatus Chlamydia corallus]